MGMLQNLAHSSVENFMLLCEPDALSEAGPEHLSAEH